jgi:hypothetical protein
MATFAKHLASARRPSEGLLLLPVAIFIAVAFLALGYVAHILWPRWPEAPVAADAPALPIVVAGVLFNIPPAAIRVPVQRRAGVQERLDLVYLWPTLTPPDPQARRTLDSPLLTGDRIFVTVAASGGTLSPGERLKLIYPRYMQAPAMLGPEGLTFATFQETSPYRGEDLVYDAAATDRFLARCTRNGKGPTRGSCLVERRLGEADITVRFPSDWITNWRQVADAIDRLVAQMRPVRG